MGDASGPPGPVHHADAERCVDAVLAMVGKEVVLGLPLGIGKAYQFANALYRRAVRDPSLKLTIFTALTLDRPRPSSDLERRFLEPMVERLFGGCPELAYARARRESGLPTNVEVHEFFLQTGALLGSADAQQSYISANYTHAARDLLARGVNVVGQLVSKRTEGGRTRYSLSCNPDITLDLLEPLERRRRAGTPIALVAEVNRNLPYMPGDAEVEPAVFDHVIENEATHCRLFSSPKRPVSTADYAAGLHVASLIRDGGTLQLGIGSIGDAVTYALKLRHEQNARFRELMAVLTPPEAQAAILEHGVFERGIYGASEMFVEGFLELWRAGILSRRVYGDARLQSLLNEGSIEEGGTEPKGGVLLHAAFLIGSQGLHRALRAMSEEDRAAFAMTSVSFTNTLNGDHRLKTLQRREARFVNNAMMATLLGAVVADGLEDGRVVSGVGGQYEFVAMAHELENARALLMLNSTRQQDGRATSNIVWNYGHTTIPRHLRDIVVTEYGVADLRGKSDREVIAAMLNIADSRFQPELLDRAKAAGKIESDYVVPRAFRDNSPERLRGALRPARQAGLLPDFPFGSDFTDIEATLAKALRRVRSVMESRAELARMAMAALAEKSASNDELPYLERLALDRPDNAKDRLLRKLVLRALRSVRTG